ncbi:hypothetical protein GCM10027028_32160 [Streptomyces sundarbansensis]
MTLQRPYCPPVRAPEVPIWPKGEGKAEILAETAMLPGGLPRVPQRAEAP